ncbi:MAG: hypothetical protein IPM12_00055 [Flavobacteriales bacterium]|nr:hypothetical protein [Flavobacteriales bacterium]
MNEEQEIKRSERIIAYVQGAMSPVERTAFEHEMATDPGLRAEVEAAQAVTVALRNEPELRFRELVTRVSAEQEQASGSGTAAPVIPIGRKPNWAWMAAAASVLVLVAIGIGNYLLPTDHAELAMNYVDRARGGVRGQVPAGVIGEEALLDSALALLQQKEVERAKSVLGTVPFTTTCTEARRGFVLALANLMQDDEATARQLLLPVTSSGCSESAPANELLEEL